MLGSMMDKVLNFAFARVTLSQYYCWNLMLMRRFAQPFLVVLACLGLLAGCGGIGFAYEKRLSGKYGLVAADVLEQMVVAEMLPNGSAIGVIPATVFAGGWNEQFIIAKPHPR